MLALRKPKPSPGVVLVDIREPTPGPDEALIEVEAAGICGTDLHIADWTGGYDAMTPAMPVTLGHEFCGRVVGGEGLALGTRVVVRPSVVCGRCPACEAERTDRCMRRVGVGIGRDGGFAARAVVPAVNCLPAGEIEPDIAALAEPLTVSAEAVRSAEVAPGARVLIVGPGPIGLGAAILAREAGASRVVVVGRGDGARLAVARRLDVDAAIDVEGASVGEALAAHGEDEPFQSIIEAAGAPVAIGQALAALDRFGVLAIAGIHGAPASIDPTALVRGHLTIRGSYRAPLATWPAVLEKLARDPERFRPLITHRLALDEALAGLQAMRSKAAVKVMLRPTAP